MCGTALTATVEVTRPRVRVLRVPATLAPVSEAEPVPACFVEGCEAPYWRTMTYNGAREPCCCKHAKRIYRRGTHEPYVPARKLLPADRLRVVELWRAGWSWQQIASKYGVSVSLVGSVTRGMVRHAWMRNRPHGELPPKPPRER